MVLKQDQQRVKSLLTDAIISILSRNGLGYKSEFCIEGLLGITFDSHDIFLINIKETIRNANLTGCSPTLKDHSLAPLDLMVFNTLGDVQTTTGEDLTMKTSTLTSTPGKKSTSFCPYLDTGSDMCVKGDTSFNFALNYADYDVIEDLSRAGCGKRIQNLTMDDLSMLDNDDMGIIMEKDVLPTVAPQLEQKCADKVSTMKAAGLGSDFDPVEQEETLDLSVQEDDILTTLPSKPATPDIVEGMPLNLSEPKKKRINKKKFECSSCHKFYKSEASLSKHKCKATSETSQPLDLTVGRLEEGNIIMVIPENPGSLCSTPSSTLTADLMNTSMDTTADNSNQNAVPQAQESSSTYPKENRNCDDEDEESLSCVCGQTFSDYDAYVAHASQCARAKQTPYKTCEICRKVFFSSSGYVKHKRLHVGAYKLRCKVCQKGFFDTTHLSAHIDARHSKVRRYECTHCDKSFYWKHHLKRHLASCGGLVVEEQQQGFVQSAAAAAGAAATSHTQHDAMDMDVVEAVSSQFDDSTPKLECQWTCNIKAT